MPEYVAHHLLKPVIEERLYQTAIFNTATKKNTLCVLPTGMGKTAIAIMLAAHRMENGGKVMIVAPTRPLAAQHQESFQKAFELPKREIVLVTGQIPPLARREYYREARIITATPQTIQNDLRTGKLDFSDFSLLIVDEVHRAVKKYAYPFVAKAYMERSKNPRILGLTASPGSDEAKINEIRKGLFIEAVEIRDEEDGDVKPYVQEKEIEIIKVPFAGELVTIQGNLKSALSDRQEKLQKYNIYARSKRDLLLAQERTSRLMKLEQRPVYFHVISLIAETIKLWHMLELLETQSISAARLYADRLKQESSRAAKRIIDDRKVNEALVLMDLVSSRGEEHPKMAALKDIIGKEMPNKIKVIVFSHYRDNIEKILQTLKTVEGCRPVSLIGQAGEKGLTQTEQIETIESYEDGLYNVLVTSSIGEEGLHISSADMAIFYDSVPSEIRTIQRRGRVGRTKVGKIVILLTKGTRDEAYYYTAKRKEQRMHDILEDMQHGKGLQRFVK